MIRLLILALMAVAVFTQIPDLAQDWLVTNGYMEARENKVSGRALASQKVTKKTSRSGRAVLRADRSGHYFAKAYLNGKSIRVVIDTGASYLSLTHEDARRIGLNLRKSDYKHTMQTANGQVKYASAKLRSVRIGQAEERNIDVMIAPKGALSITLMGMSYLRKLKSFQVRQDQLLLES